MKTIILSLLLISLVSCKKTTINVPAKITIIHFNPTDEKYYPVSFLLQSKLPYYTDLNTLFINAAKSKGKGC